MLENLHFLKIYLIFFFLVISAASMGGNSGPQEAHALMTEPAKAPSGNLHFLKATEVTEAGYFQGKCSAREGPLLALAQ